MKIDGKKLDAWGKYENDSHEMIYFKHLFSNHYITDTIPVTIIRNKKKKKINLQLASIDDTKWLIPRNLQKKQIPYLIRGGFVFIPMTLSFLQEWGNNFMNNGPLALIESFSQNKYKIKNNECNQLIILSRVLPHPSNIGLQSLGNTVISKVNGETLKNLEQLKLILDNNKNKVVKFSLAPGDIPLWVNSDSLKNADGEIQMQYGIYQLEHFTEE